MSLVAFADAFDRICGWMRQKRRAWKIVENLAPGATAAQFAAAEARLGFPLGAELRALWSVHAGQREELDGFVESYDLLSIDRAIDETRSLRHLVAATRTMPDFVPRSGLTEAELASEAWVMFAARDSDGLAVNTMSGRVFHVAHDDAPPLHFQAPSLLAWITAYASRVVAGDYRLEEGFGDYYLVPRDRKAEARARESAMREREEKKRKSRLPPRTLLEEAIAKNDPNEAQSILERALGAKNVDVGELVTTLFATAPSPAFIASTLRTTLRQLALSSAQWLVVSEGGAQLGNNAIRDVALARSKTAT